MKKLQGIYPRSRIIEFEDPQKLATAGARLLMEAARRACSLKGTFAVALSGGSTPRGMHRLLAGEPYRSRIPWKATHLFWGDERCVPQSDPASNYRTAQKDFLERLELPPGHIHPIPGHLPPWEAARIYEEELWRYFNLYEEGRPILDLVFLGVGMDGHTAGLFPHDPALEERAALVTATFGGSPPLPRVTMTLPILNSARLVVFLVSGHDKAPILKTVFRKKRAQLPAQRILPKSGSLIWLVAAH